MIFVSSGTNSPWAPQVMSAHQRTQPDEMSDGPCHQCLLFRTVRASIQASRDNKDDTGQTS